MATQEKTWNVANRLHSQKDSDNPAVDHIIAGADEIYDDAKQIKQSEHNAQTDSRLNVVESDINAQSSGIKDRLETLENEVSFEGEIQVENTPQGIVSGSGKVATANAVSGAINVRTGYFVCDTATSTAAKTVDAPGFVLAAGGSIKVKMTNTNTANSVTLNINSTGAKPLYYAGEPASANNPWEAGETVEVYYNGTNYYANNVAGGSGSGDGAFDVSAKYPTSGVDGGNTYTLDGALAVLDANLPTSKKKGGMDIKFIDSVSGKYKQWHLRKATFSTTPTDWESIDNAVLYTQQTLTQAEQKQARANLGFGDGDIDDEPTAGSGNLVKSGGVYRSTPTVANSTAESDLDISDEQGNVLARFAGGHLQVKNFSSADAIESIQAILSNIGFDNVPEFDEETNYAVGDIVRYGKYVYVFTSVHTAGEWDETDVEKTVLTSESQVEVRDSESEADLDISDEDGNVLARFKNGNIKTKYFDSAKNVGVGDSSENVDLDISDENGNVLAMFTGGNIKTKYFDSLKTNLNIDSLKSSIGDLEKTGNVIYVAASNSINKSCCKYVCDGSNDTEILQTAINYILSIGGGEIILRKGRYYINSVNAAYHCLEAHVGDKQLEIEGELINLNRPTSTGQEDNTGAQLYMTNALYESLDSETQYTLLHTTSNNWSGGIFIKNLGIVIPYNQKKIIGIDQENFTGMTRLDTVQIHCYNKTYQPSVGVGNPPAMPVDGTIGIRTNCWVGVGVIGTEYVHCLVKGFYEGFSINCDHPSLILCAAVFCAYGYTFNRYVKNSGGVGPNHPAMLLRCQDERNTNLPIFYNFAKNFAVYIYALNIERYDSICPGGVVGDFASEEVPGQYRGEITFTRGEDGRADLTTTKFWEDGEGHNINTINMAMPQYCTSSERTGLQPMYLQKIWDTTLNKELICTNETTKEWRDFEGNIV